MKAFILTLLTGSFLMSAVSLILAGVGRIRKNLSLIKGIYHAWTVILFGFIAVLFPLRIHGLISIDTGAKQAVQTAQSNAVQTFDPYNLLFVIWIYGVLICLTVTLFRQIKWIRTLKKSLIAADERTVCVAEKVKKEMNICTNVKVRLFPGCVTPMMTGLFTPTVILPQRGFSDAELEMIFSHEFTHFKHRDIWKSALLLLCRAIHWFNPFFLIIKRCMEDICELYCDGDAMKNRDRQTKKQYCRLIIDIAAGVSSDLSPVISTAFYEKKEDLKNRMCVILTENKGFGFSLILVAVLILTVLATSLFSFADEQDMRAVTTTGLSFSQNIEETTFVENEYPTSAAEEYAIGNTTTVTTFIH